MFSSSLYRLKILRVFSGCAILAVSEGWRAPIPAVAACSKGSNTASPKSTLAAESG